MTQLTALATQLASRTVLAAAGDVSSFNSEGLVAFLLSKAVPLLLAGIGVFIITGARGGNWSKAFSTVGLTLLGIVVIVGAGGLVFFGTDIAHLAFKS